MNCYIYFGQYYGKSFFSKFIKFFTWSIISHTSAFRPPKDSKFSTVIEAWGGGVEERIWTKGHKPGTVIDVYRVPCSEAQMNTFYRFMESKKGKGYDYWGICGFPLRLSINKVDKWFCSELVFSGFNKVGISLLTRISAYKVFPGMLNVSPIPEFFTKLVVPEKVQ